ncbi:MAG: hypothetical protein LUC50_06050 [Ruminococcus sp.]|nr:hypothetical protein [Ruminococcus sp.]
MRVNVWDCCLGLDFFGFCFFIVCALATLAAAIALLVSWRKKRKTMFLVFAIFASVLFLILGTVSVIGIWLMFGSLEYGGII